MYREMEARMTKFMVIVYGAFVVLIVLQSAFFSVLLIQYSDSKTFRLLIGFIGLGWLIVMPVMGLAKFSTGEAGGARPVRSIVMIVIMLVMPWIPVISGGFKNGALNAVAVPVAALSLSAAIGGSAINTITISAANPDGVSWKMGVLRWSLSILLLSMSLNLFFPAFARLAAALAPRLGLDASLLIGSAVADRLWEAIFSSIGNIYVWMLDFFVTLWASIKFYRVFFSKDGI